MSNHHTQHGKVVVTEGTVTDVTQFIKTHVKEKTESLACCGRSEWPCCADVSVFIWDRWPCLPLGFP